MKSRDDHKKIFKGPPGECARCGLFGEMAAELLKARAASCWKHSDCVPCGACEEWVEVRIREAMERAGVDDEE